MISKSSIGAGGDDKFAKLKELKEMLSEGLIDDDEFKQMKKEILGK
ncbi:MAG: SHOCT domain-containing protein [Candidatus Poseidoniia archaeon]|nr:SHOCT domain-containing protein [Candidatus Poseidoniia archaeon]